MAESIAALSLNDPGYPSESIPYLAIDRKEMECYILDRGEI